MGKKEFVLWGTKNGVEDVIKINGKEVQESKIMAEKIKKIIENKKIFKKVRIQEIDMNIDNFANQWRNLVK